MAAQRIVFDLDGVLRDLQGYLKQRLGVPCPTTWEWLHQGKDIFQLIKEDHYAGLVYAPATPYYTALRISKYPVELWTYQKPEWRPYTKLWIQNHFGEDVVVRFLKPDEKRAELDKHPELLLVEDYPNFTNYERIILIDQPWNQEVVAQRFVFPEQLTDLISNLGVPQAPAP